MPIGPTPVVFPMPSGAIAAIVAFLVFPSPLDHRPLKSPRGSFKIGGFGGLPVMALSGDESSSSFRTAKLFWPWIYFENVL